MVIGDECMDSTGIRNAECEDTDIGTDKAWALTEVNPLAYSR